MPSTQEYPLVAVLGDGSGQDPDEWQRQYWTLERTGVLPYPILPTTRFGRRRLATVSGLYLPRVGIGSALGDRPDEDEQLMELIRIAIGQGLPVLGVGFGAVVLNEALGGTTIARHTPGPSGTGPVRVRIQVAPEAELGIAVLEDLDRDGVGIATVHDASCVAIAAAEQDGVFKAFMLVDAGGLANEWPEIAARPADASPYVRGWTPQIDIPGHPELRNFARHCQHYANAGTR